MLSKMQFFAKGVRRNRFPSGRNRVPGIFSSRGKILCRGNWFPGGRNRVPSMFYKGTYGVMSKSERVCRVKASNTLCYCYYYNKKE